MIACGSGGDSPGDGNADANVTVQGQSELPVRGSAQFTATTVNGSDSAYAWATSSPAVATVDSNGMVTGVSEGEVTISAQGQDSGAQGSYALRVFIPTEDVPFYQEWANSGHADLTAEAFRHWDDDGEISASCAKCHSRYGFHDFIGEDGSAPGQVDSGHPTGSVVDCVTCHNDAALELRDVTFPSGVTVTAEGREAVCMTCHQGRASTDSVDAAILAAAPLDDDEVLPDQGFINVHYFPAAATRYGGQVRGGYLYEGETYDVRFRHVEGAHDCQECHSPHSLELELGKCGSCHNGVAEVEDTHHIRMLSSVTRDYDGDGNRSEGLWFEIEGLRNTLYTAIQKYSKEVVGQPILYDSHSYPYWFNDTNGNGVADEGEVGYGNRYKTFTSRSLKATFNFQYATKDPGGFAHNGKFIIQILHDSIQDLNKGLDENDRTPLEFNGVRNDVGHFDGTAGAFRHWDEDGEVSSRCAKCHSGAAGFAEYLTYGANTNQEITNGFECAVCHSNTQTFELRIARTVTFPSGYETPSALGDQTDPAVQSNLCMTCHQGRVSKVQIDEAIAADNLRFQNIHYLAAGATLMGNLAKGGYEYEGEEYAGRWAHSSNATNNNCTNCHNAWGTTHTFHPKDNFDYCKNCHKSATTFEDIRVGSDLDYNKNGDTAEPLKAELESIAADLLKQIQVVARNNDAPICYDGHGYPYFFNDTNDNGICDPDEAKRSNGYKAWTPELIKAAHNYQHSQKEPGAWVHNFAYITQLVIDSYRKLGGSEDDHIRPPTGP
ncbi:MAG: Ig-like domain-containing protein [Planctomycetota bacterium]